MTRSDKISSASNAVLSAAADWATKESTAAAAKGILQTAVADLSLITATATDDPPDGTFVIPPHSGLNVRNWQPTTVGSYGGLAVGSTLSAEGVTHTWQGFNWENTATGELTDDAGIPADAYVYLFNNGDTPYTGFIAPRPE